MFVNQLRDKLFVDLEVVLQLLVLFLQLLYLVPKVLDLLLQQLRLRVLAALRDGETLASQAFLLLVERVVPGVFLDFVGDEAQ